MALIDEVKIRVKAGKGGDGSHSFKINYGSQRRVPDGGSGGNGGNVYFEGTHNLNDLGEFRYKKFLKASDGENGRKKTLLGKNGEDLTIKVPLGTTIIKEGNEEAFEITKDGERVLVAHGGRKGIGNYYYKLNKKNFRPIRDIGEDGEEYDLRLILNMIADVGLVGLPNAGKSSLLSKITKATPKIGNYEFTTIEPNLGVFDNIVIADIPGLIEGAHKGRGLGISFLKHITKTKMLIHLIDATSTDVTKDYSIVINEFKNFSDKLLLKQQILVLTKIDLLDKEEIDKKIKQLKKINEKVYCISIYDNNSLQKLCEIIKKEYAKLGN